ncbi:hypothetical protein HJG60_010384 [Phyllostomus discolor]|uniref:Uncharacterized protein n=1 Tax=Phyllostomus discolor TaxID=89673 RepID=A0A834AZA6_9CHIR|nr:hypothetical protein HJG60_010384 [Phyllostomus discolor]
MNYCFGNVPLGRNTVWHQSSSRNGAWVQHSAVLQIVKKAERSIRNKMLKEPSIKPESVPGPCPKPTLMTARGRWSPGTSALPRGVSQVLTLSLTHALKAVGLSYPHVPLVTGAGAGHQTRPQPLWLPLPVQKHGWVAMGPCPPGKRLVSDSFAARCGHVMEDVGHWRPDPTGLVQQLD